MIAEGQTVKPRCSGIPSSGHPSNAACLVDGRGDRRLRDTGIRAWFPLDVTPVTV